MIKNKEDCYDEDQRIQQKIGPEQKNRCKFKSRGFAEH
jgi:hypothetical protein